MRSSLDNQKKKNKDKKLEKASIIASREFPEEHKLVIAKMKEMGIDSNNNVVGNIFNELKSVFTDKKTLNNMIKFAK